MQIRRINFYAPYKWRQIAKNDALQKFFTIAKKVTPVYCIALNFRCRIKNETFFNRSAAAEQIRCDRFVCREENFFEQKIFEQNLRTEELAAVEVC